LNCSTPPLLHKTNNKQKKTGIGLKFDALFILLLSSRKKSKTEKIGRKETQKGKNNTKQNKTEQANKKQQQQQQQRHRKSVSVTCSLFLRHKRCATYFAIFSYVNCLKYHCISLFFHIY